jgi:hypothetical protein
MKRHHVLTGAVIATLVLVTGLAYAQGVAPERRAETEAALGTAFTYQGQLSDEAGLVDGRCDLTFELYDDPVSGAPLGDVQKPNHPISDGTFTAELDFGSDVFRGEARWLQVTVDCGDGPVPLRPRQRLTPAPYALYAPSAGAVPWSGVTDPPAGLDDGDDDTTYAAGTGLRLTGGTFSLEESYRLPQSCANGQIAEWDGGAWTCGDDDTGTTGSFWSLTGNAGTTPGTHFLGTTDVQALELRVNGERALRLEPHPASPTLIGGHGSNSVDTTVVGATVGGGGQAGAANRVTDNYGTVGGGSDNQAGDGQSTTANAAHATVSGGTGNTASGRTATVGGGEGNTASGIDATVAGGDGNCASANRTTVAGGISNTAGALDASVGGGNGNTAGGSRSTVSGGHGNTADGDGAAVGGGRENQAAAMHATAGGGFQNSAGGQGATVGGGLSNTADVVAATVAGGWSNEAGGEQAAIGGGYGNVADGNYATVSGGWSNEAGGNQAVVAGGWQNSAAGNYAIVLGGRDNTADGHFSLAAGRRAKADHQGCFVWGDSTNADVACDANDEWVARATGGVTFFSGSGTGVMLPPGGTEWIPYAPVSDRNQKENLVPVNPRSILERVTALPVRTWNYKADDDELRHVGPMAQDFHAAFNVGEDDKHISGIDADGVALASIQALYEISQERAAQIEALEAENAELRHDLDELAARVAALEGAPSGGPSPIRSGLVPGAGGLLAAAGLVLMVRRGSLVKPREEDER